MNMAPRSTWVFPLSKLTCVSAGPLPDSCSVVQTGERKESRPGSCCVELPAKPRDSQGTEHLWPPLSYFTMSLQVYNQTITSKNCSSSKQIHILNMKNCVYMQRTVFNICENMHEALHR